MLAQHCFTKLIGEMILMGNGRHGTAGLKHNRAKQGVMIFGVSLRQIMFANDPFEQLLLPTFKLAKLFLEDGVLRIKIISRALRLDWCYLNYSPRLEIVEADLPLAH